MTELEVYALLGAVFTAGLKGSAFGVVAVTQADQPRITGAPAGNAILLSNIGSRRVGFLRREAKRYLDRDPPVEIQTEKQSWELTLQCNAQILIEPAPEPLPAYTAGDLVARASSILMGDRGREALKAGGAGILRITGIRSPNIKNDRDQFQSSPSFDFTLAYTVVDTFEVPILTAYEFQTRRV